MNAVFNDYDFDELCQHRYFGSYEDEKLSILLEDFFELEAIVLNVNKF